MPAQSDNRTRIAAGAVDGGCFMPFSPCFAWWSLNHVPVPAVTSGNHRHTAAGCAGEARPRAAAALPGPSDQAACRKARAAGLHHCARRAAARAASAARNLSPWRHSGNGPMGRRLRATAPAAMAALAGCLDAVWMRCGDRAGAPVLLLSGRGAGRAQNGRGDGAFRGAPQWPDRTSCRSASHPAMRGSTRRPSTSCKRPSLCRRFRTGCIPTGSMAICR